MSQPAGSNTTDIGLLQATGHQIGYDWRDLIRDRQARFFAVGLPIVFLLLFCTIFGDATLDVAGQVIKESTYYVAGITTYGIVDMAFVSLVVVTVEARESGLLRRRQATPQPPGAVIASRAVTALAGAGALAVLLVVIGRLVYGADVSPGDLLPLAVAIVVGCAAFVSLGFAVSTVTRSTQSAQPVALGLSMPLFFVSGVFVPWNDIPSWLRAVSDVFPVRNEALAILNPFVHGATAGAWSWTNLLVVAVWGAAGLAVAVRRFRWSPQEV